MEFKFLTYFLSLITLSSLISILKSVETKCRSFHCADLKGKRCAEQIILPDGNYDYTFDSCDTSNAICPFNEINPLKNGTADCIPKTVPTNKY